MGFFDGKPCQSLSVEKAQTNLFHYSILNLFLTCSSLLSSFCLTVFIKIFLIQKSKSSTNLNHKESKQEEATTD